MDMQNCGNAPSSPDDEPLAESPADEDEQHILVPVSAIEHFSYCPRQCALIHIEQTFEENVFTMRSHDVHERVDDGEGSVSDGVHTVRAMPLRSRRLGLTGKADAVEMRPEGPYPVEYKPGQRHGLHADAQLWAQALCLEEMMGQPVPRGAIYYFATRSRYEVLIDEKLRRQTLQIIDHARALLRSQAMPPALNDARCPTCSLVDVCMPAVLAEPARLRGLQSTLFSVYDAETEGDTGG
jgi:CRISPR-associated exonuclease Cas4